MSFINTLANDVWSESDIINHTEAMIASEFPKSRIDILTRKVQGQAMGYVLTEQEQADLGEYQAVCYEAGAAADAARADMTLLMDTMVYEAATKRILLPEVLEPLTLEVTDVEGMVSQVPNPAIEQDAAERADASIKIANASPEVLALYELRNPVLEAEVPDASAV